MVMERLFKLMADKKASDLFLSVGSPINIKINGVAIPVNQQKLDSAAVEALVREVLSERQWNEFVERRELNTGYSLRDVGSFRINVFQQRGSPGCVIRYIPGDIPRFDEPEPAVGAERPDHGEARPGAGRRFDRVRQVDDAGVDDRLPQRTTARGTS